MFEVEQLCERIAIMKDGKIIVDAPPSALRDMLRDIHAIEVEIKEANNIKEVIKILGSLPMVKQVMEVKNDPYIVVIRLQVDDEYDAIPLIANKLHSMNAKVLAVRRSEPTLEDIFVKLTKEETA
jgi:ABC-2 type transport system ATP-binding protein